MKITPQPTWRAARVTHITVDWLRTQKLKVVLLDIDNTILRLGHDKPAPDICFWVKGLQAAGIRICLVTNAWPKRAHALAQQLGVDCVVCRIWIGRAKPHPEGFRRALALYPVRLSEVVMVGDQLFRDVHGAHACGIKSILVHPLSQREYPWTRWQRRRESGILTQTVIPYIPPPPP